MKTLEILLLAFVIFASACTAKPQEMVVPITGIKQIEATTTTTTTTTTTLPTATLPQTVSAKSFTIEADDSGFYPSSQIEVNKGENVTITFKVRQSGVYYGGLQIKSSVFDTGAVSPGGSKSVSFTATESFTFTSYWPLTSTKKADGKVMVA